MAKNKARKAQKRAAAAQKIGKTGEKAGYLKVITLPLVVWILWDLVGFALGIMFAKDLETAMAQGGFAAGTGAVPGVLLILGIFVLVAWAINAVVGAWIGWRAITMMRCGYMHVAIAAVIAALANILVTFVLDIASFAITMPALGSLAATVVAMMFSVLMGALFVSLFTIVFALVGAFAAKLLKK